MMIRLTDEVAVNPDHVTHIQMEGRTDQFTEPHVSINLSSGLWVELPPEHTLDGVLFLLRERTLNAQPQH